MLTWTVPVHLVLIAVLPAAVFPFLNYSAMVEYYCWVAELWFIAIQMVCTLPL